MPNTAFFNATQNQLADSEWCPLMFPKIYQKGGENMRSNKNKTKRAVLATVIGLAMAFSVLFGSQTSTSTQAHQPVNQVTIVADGGTGGQPPGGG